MAKKDVRPDVYMVSIDGTRAPQMEHATLDAAIEEAERLGQQLFLQGNKNAKIRVLKEIGQLSVKVETKVVKNWS